MQVNRALDKCAGSVADVVVAACGRLVRIHCVMKFMQMGWRVLTGS